MFNRRRQDDSPSRGTQSPLDCNTWFVAPVRWRSSANGRPSPILPAVIIQHGGSGGNHECGDHGRCRFRAKFKQGWQGNFGQGNFGQGNSGQGNSGQGNFGQGNFGQGNWIPVLIPLPHIPLPVVFSVPGIFDNATAAGAGRSRAAMGTADLANGPQPSGLGLVLVDRKMDDRKMGTAPGSEDAIFLSSIFLSSFRPLDS